MTKFGQINVVTDDSVPANTIIIRGSIDENNIVNIGGAEEYIQSNKKPKFEDVYKKDTFWVDKEKLTKLHGITKGNKGLKTQIINEALELFFKKNKI